MKTLTFCAMLLLFFSLPQLLVAQNSPLGFFVGGSATALMMNGKGETESEDFSVADDFFTMTADEDMFGLTLNITYQDGWLWDSKLLYGFKPVVGYRFSPRLAVFGSYNYFLTKESEQKDSYSSIYINNLNFNMNATMEYSQRSILIMGQFYPMAGSGLFLTGGMEFVSLTGEKKYTLIINDAFGTETYPWIAKGSDKTSGLVLGGGIELPISSGNIAFIGTVLYSLTKYDGDELLEVKEAPGVVTDPNIDIKLGVGGLMFDVGLRLYFNSPAGIK